MSDGPDQIPLFAPAGPDAPAEDEGPGEETAPPEEGPREPEEAPAAPRVAEGRPDEEAPPGSSPEAAITVSALNAATKRLLEDHYPPLWVTGEVANWRQVSSGHCYFSLRDEEAQISCVMWRSDARRLPTEPEEGMEVCAHGRVSLYEARGTYQLMVRKMEAVGEGLWRLAFERLRRKLAEEGLLAEERKRPVPRVPTRVGVVTSRTGAALRDVVSVIRRRAPWTRVLVSDCRVQGEEASGEIVRALGRLERHGGCEVIIVTRGGGSVEDLWAFNEEEVARAVVGCAVPVISAVGHEVDVTITDLVADRRAPTPSAAGEVAVPEETALRAALRRLGDGLVAGLRDRVRTGRERAGRAAERMVASTRRRLERAGAKLDRLEGRLDALSPLGTLQRGYAVPLGPGGEVLRSVSSFSEGDIFRLRVADGRVEARVEETGEIRDRREGGDDVH